MTFQITALLNIFFIFILGVPLSVLSCSAIYMFSKRGMIKPSGVKYFIALTASYFLGNWSYRNIMRDRIINSNSDSSFAQSLRRSVGNS